MIGGLDIGTSNCKLSIYDDDRLLVQTEASYAASREGGRHVLCADKVWDAVQTLFRRAVATEPRAADVKALAVSSLGEAAVPVDGEGKTLGDALLFWDARGKEEMDAIVARIGGDVIQNITGVLPDPMYTLCKMAWHKNHNPLYGRIRHFFLFEDFIIHRLTGERRISFSLAGRTMGFDIARQCWSPVLFEAAGVDMGLMSVPVASGTPAGRLRRSVRDALGLRADTLVTTGGHDQMCVAVGSGAVREGIASNGSGTVEVMAATVPDAFDPTALHAGSYTLSTHADPARLFTYSCNATGSLLLAWYVGNFGDPESRTPFADFEAKAPTAPTSLLALPYIAGSGTPFMDLGVTGSLCGVTPATTRYDVYRALMEGLSFDLAYNIERIGKAKIPVTELRTTGGGSLSRLWSQIKADVTGLPVYTLRNHQAGALGCMLLAAVACGKYKNVYEAVDARVIRNETFEPDPKNHAFYMERKERFLAAFRAVRDIVRQ